MRRRDFITLLGGTAAASSGFWPLMARAQDAALPEIGILSSVPFDFLTGYLDAFFGGLETTGFVESRNMTTAYRSAPGQSDWLPGLADDLVNRHCKAIVCLTSANTVRAAMAATGTIPIVFAISGDPVELGLVANLARPEGNVTGAARVTEALNGDRLKVLCELVPAPQPVAFLLNSANAPATTIKARVRQMEEAADAIGRRLVVLDLAGNNDLSAIFATMTKLGVAGFVISTEALFEVWRDQVIALSARNNIAAMFPNREYVQSGGLISYGADLYEHYRIAGAYTGRILKDEHPAAMPVQIPTKFEMVINLTTAKALGLTVPERLLKDATELVE